MPGFFFLIKVTQEVVVVDKSASGVDGRRRVAEASDDLASFFEQNIGRFLEVQLFQRAGPCRCKKDDNQSNEHCCDAWTCDAQRYASIFARRCDDLGPKEFHPLPGLLREVRRQAKRLQRQAPTPVDSVGPDRGSAESRAPPPDRDPSPAWTGWSATFPCEAEPVHHSTPRTRAFR
ncbi:MAG: hypothetical protein DMG57_26295 [Acidobacteria bacterium]|nr:MAG: hypothetical protein DMG57_26295 [Acidobacteriota bacterium]